MKEGQNYLSLGLTGLARCEKAIWDAHFPAAVLAGQFFIENNDLPPQCAAAIRRQMDQIIASKSEYFVPYADSSKAIDPLERLSQSIENSIDTVSELGHNSIFLHYALRVLKRLTDLASEALIQDLCKTVHNCKFSPAKYWIKLQRGHGPKTFHVKKDQMAFHDLDLPRMANAIMEELCEFQFIYTQMGSKSHIGHLITQGQSLIHLKNMGFSDLAKRGLHSFETRMMMLRDFRNYEAPKGSFYTPATRSDHLPISEDYWAQSFIECQWDEGHCLKYTYSFYELINLVADEALIERATEKFRYLITPNERSKPR